MVASKKNKIATELKIITVLFLTPISITYLFQWCFKIIVIKIKKRIKRAKKPHKYPESIKKLVFKIVIMLIILTNCKINYQKFTKTPEKI
jgi:uncharacterized membrane protein